MSLALIWLAEGKQRDDRNVQRRDANLRCVCLPPRCAHETGWPPMHPSFPHPTKEEKKGGKEGRRDVGSKDRKLTFQSALWAERQTVAGTVLLRVRWRRWWSGALLQCVRIRGFFLPTSDSLQVVDAGTTHGVCLCDEHLRAYAVLGCSRLSVVRYQVRSVLIWQVRYVQ
jgi:hypothetical protein